MDVGSRSCYISNDTKAAFVLHPKEKISEKEIVTYLLDLRPELKASYDLYHDLRYFMNSRSFDLLKTDLSTHENSIPAEAPIKTFQVYTNHLKNTFKHSNKNKVLIGFNKNIKAKNRIIFHPQSFFETTIESSII